MTTHATELDAEIVPARAFEPTSEDPIDPHDHALALRALSLIADGGDGPVSAAAARAALKLIAGEVPEIDPDEAALRDLDHALVAVGSALQRLGPCGCDAAAGRMCRACGAYLRLTCAAEDVRELITGECLA